MDNKVIAAVQSHAEAMAEALSALVRIPTVNPYSGDPQPSGEAAGQRFFEGLLRQAGARTRLIDVPADVYQRTGVLGPRGRSFAGRQSLVGEFAFGSGRGPAVILNSHMDTVGVSDYEGEPFSGRRDGETVHGRGSSDAKCGLVAALFAVKALQACDAALDGRVLIQSVVDEECNGSGAGTLACCLAGIKADYAIVLDGTAGGLLDGCQGIVTAEVSVHGRAGHGSVGGVSAVDKLRLAMTAIDRLKAERAAEHPGALLNIGAVRAGLAPWTVPNRGWLAANVNYLFEEAATAAVKGLPFGGVEVRSRFEALLSEVSAGDEWLREHPPEIVWMKDVPPYRLADFRDGEVGQAANALLSAARASHEAIWGTPARVGPMSAWFDASHLARVAGIPTLGLGCGEPGTMHAASEHNRLSNVVRGAGVAALTILRLLGAARPTRTT